MKRFVITVAATAGLVLGLGLAGAGSALASPAMPHPVPNVVLGNVYTDYLSGVSGSGLNGRTHLDNLRTQGVLFSQAESVPAIPNNCTDTPGSYIGGSLPMNLPTGGPGCLVVGIAQQQSAVAISDTIGEGWVWDNTTTAGCGENTWTLETTDGSFSEIPGTPVPPADLTVVTHYDPVTLSLGPVCEASGPFYLEQSYNSRTHEETFLAGSPSLGDPSPAWNQDVVVAHSHVGYQPQYIAGVGLDSTHLSGAPSDMVTGTVVSFSRARVSTRGPHGANESIAKLNNTIYNGTLHGGAPSVANPLTLATSLPTLTGSNTSSFFISAP